jgi:lysozyme
MLLTEKIWLNAMRKLRLNFLTSGLIISLTASVVALLEGYSPQAYLDTGGVPTICYGETRNVKLGDVASKQKCDELLIKEVTRISESIKQEYTIKLKPHELAALTSFRYNVGDTAFRRSTLARHLRNHDIVSACNQLQRWVHVDGKKITGLVNRRKFETDLCFGKIQY